MTNRLYCLLEKLESVFILLSFGSDVRKKKLKIVDKFHVDGVDKLIENQPERMQSCQKLAYIHRHTFFFCFFWYKV